jgi:hypothetical protein
MIHMLFELDELAQENMCRMLSRSGELKEVVLYEAADWAYRLPWDGFDFLDRCSPRTAP